MINIKRALRDDRLLRALTGNNRKSFNKLLITFAPLADRVPYKQNRIRKHGAGRNHTLETAAEKLFFILFYMKCYPTYDLAGFFFEVDRAQPCRWVQHLMKNMGKSLGKTLSLPERKIKSMKEFIARFPEIKEIIIDGTERPIQRPKEKERQKKHYSGKKKRHMQKNLVVTHGKKKILVVTSTEPGSEHDLTLLKKSKLPQIIPKKIKTYLDLGFKGIDKQYPLNVVMPERKPRTRKLTQKQKSQNKKISRHRVKIENAIAGIKRFRCLTDVCRTKIEKLKDDFMVMGAGLWNFYMEAA